MNSKISLKLRDTELKRAYSPIAKRFGRDKRFIESYKKLDINKLEKQFLIFTKKIKRYNDFHRTERRLWYLKIGRGKIDKKFETSFRKEIPNAIKDYKEGFVAINSCLEIVEKCGMMKSLNSKMDVITGCLNNERHPLSGAFHDFFKDIGCSTKMIDEFKNQFSQYDYDFVKILGGKIENSYKILEESVDAQVTILKHTQENGMDYIRGKCGPPGWAITASKILAAGGISISAWVVVGIILGILAILVIICLTVKADWVQKLCKKLTFQLPAFEFE